MKKYFLAVFTIFLLSFIFALPANAICPVCTVAVGAGVGLAQWLGIDDTITGLWIGGLTISLIMWTINWLSSKNIRFKGRKILVFLGYYALIVVPLHFMGILWHPFNTLWGVDKLVLGVVLGSIAFFAGAIGYNELKKKNNNKAHFPFEKVVLSISPLIILTVIFYFLTR